MSKNWKGFYHISDTTGKPEKCYAQSPNTCTMQNKIHSKEKNEIKEEIKNQGKSKQGLLAGIQKDNILNNDLLEQLPDHYQIQDNIIISGNERISDDFKELRSAFKNSSEYNLYVGIDGVSSGYDDLLTKNEVVGITASVDWDLNEDIVKNQFELLGNKSYLEVKNRTEDETFDSEFMDNEIITKNATGQSSKIFQLKEDIYPIRFSSPHYEFLLKSDNPNFKEQVERYKKFSYYANYNLMDTLGSHLNGYYSIEEKDFHRFTNEELETAKNIAYNFSNDESNYDNFRKDADIEEQVIDMELDYRKVKQQVEYNKGGINLEVSKKNTKQMIKNFEKELKRNDLNNWQRLSSELNLKHEKRILELLN